MTIDKHHLRFLYENKSKEEVLDFYAQILAEMPAQIDWLTGFAASYADADALRFLFDKGASAAATDEYGYTLLHRMYVEWPQYWSGRTDEMISDTVNLRLDKRVSVLKKDENIGLCCYHYAAREGGDAFIRALRLRDAKLDMTGGRDGNTALQELAEYYFASGAGNPGQEARSDAFIRAAKELIQAGVDVSAKNNDGHAASHFVLRRTTAVNDGQPRFWLLIENPTLFDAIAARMPAEALTQIGGDTNIICGDGKFKGHTPLGMACGLFNPSMVKALFDMGADANYKNDDGRTALAEWYPEYGRGIAEYYFADYASDGISNVKIILNEFKSRGWDMESPADNEGRTFFNLAVKSGCRSKMSKTVFDWLMGNGANVNAADNAGMTPLMHACNGDFSDREAQQLVLLEAGADVGAKDSQGRTALHYVAMNDDRNANLAKTFADMLYSFGKPDANLADNDGKTALDYATERNNEELVKFLLGKM